jgi:hypothetical protein
MTAWASGHEAIVAIKTYNYLAKIKEGERIPSDPCCWHCRYYIRPTDELILDGPVTSICTIDRQKDIYPNPMYLSPGDHPREPAEHCDRFEMASTTA